MYLGVLGYVVLEAFGDLVLDEGRWLFEAAAEKERRGGGLCGCGASWCCPLRLVLALVVRIAPVFVAKQNLDVLRMSWCGQRRSMGGS
ncbi:MAG: hypothetical protein ACLRWQ_14155 [Flavonifractor plautii]